MWQGYFFGEYSPIALGSMDAASRTVKIRVTSLVVEGD